MQQSERIDTVRGRQRLCVQVLSMLNLAQGGEQQLRDSDSDRVLRIFVCLDSDVFCEFREVLEHELPGAPSAQV